MKPSFVPCPECDRHVRMADRACPFCAAAMPDLADAAPRPVPRALTRAAILFAGATAVAGCGAAVTPEDAAGDTVAADSVANDGPGPTDSGGDVAPDNVIGWDAVPLYGPAPVDSGTDASDAVRPMPDAPVAAYGPAPVDGG